MNNLKMVTDGARSLDGANTTSDLKTQSLNANTNLNTTSFDMIGHDSLLYMGHIGTLGAASNANLVVQESNDNTTFTSITGTAINLNAANSVWWGEVNWRHPDRKRYARLQLQPAISNATLIGGNALRVQPRGPNVNTDSGVTQTLS